jgi:hypothetical protein
MPIPFDDWFPLAAVGVVFTAIGLIKLYGLRRGIVGGANKPIVQQLCGT